MLPGQLYHYLGIFNDLIKGFYSLCGIQQKDLSKYANEHAYT